MKKKLLALLLALALMASLFPAVLAVEYGAELDPNEKTYAQRFSDVPTNHWAFQYVGELVERGAINGYPDGKFYPDKIVTREEFAKIMVVAAGLSVAPANASSYADVDLTYWASPFIETAKPYMTSYQESWGMCFHPTDGALREDIAVAVVKLKGYDTRLADLSIIRTMFSDVDGISAAAQPYVALAVENGIISGYVDGTFRGQATITRSEAAAMLWRAFQYGNDNKVIAAETSAAPSPSAKPSVAPSPSPSPKPTLPPEPAEKIKPFVAETLVKNVKLSDPSTMMAMDDDSNLIFYNENTDQIVSLDPDTGRTKVLLDVATATCEMPAEGETASLSAVEDEEPAGNGDTDVPDDQEPQPPEETGEPEEPGETEPEPAPPATITYEDLTVEQVFWDDVADRLLVVGRFASAKAGGDVGWTLPGKDKGLSGIFILSNGEMTYLADKPSWSDFDDHYYSQVSYTLNRIQCAIGDGTFVIAGTDGGYRDDRSFIFDIMQGESIAKINDYASDYQVCQNNSELYSFNNYHLYRYNYGTRKLEKITSDENSTKRYANNVIYAWSSDGIKVIRPTDGATQDKLDPSEDVEVKDLRPLPSSPDSLFVTADEQYLFYDGSASAIRVIRPNPDA